MKKLLLATAAVMAVSVTTASATSRRGNDQGQAQAQGQIQGQLQGQGQSQRAGAHAGAKAGAAAIGINKNGNTNRNTNKAAGGNAYNVNVDADRLNNRSRNDLNATNKSRNDLNATNKSRNDLNATNKSKVDTTVNNGSRSKSGASADNNVSNGSFSGSSADNAVGVSTRNTVGNDADNSSRNANATYINESYESVALGYDTIDLANLPVANCQGSSASASGGGQDGLMGVNLGFAKSKVDEQCTIRENIRLVGTLAAQSPELKPLLLSAIAELDGFEVLKTRSSEHPKCREWLRKGKAKKLAKHGCFGQ